MENKIDISKLLKDCPRGMELDCTMYEDVKFIKIEDDDKPICIRTGDIYRYLTKFGTWTFDENAKCVIFPKGETTWEGFVPPYKFKDGDVLVHTQNDRFIMSIYKSNKNEQLINTHAILWDREEGLSVGMQICCYTDNVRLATEEEKERLFDAIKEHGYKWNEETKTLEKLMKFKDGDIITCSNGACTFTSIFKDKPTDTSFQQYCSVILDNNKFIGGILYYVDYANPRFATEEEKEKLFDAIKANGYKWNEETKTLEKLVESHSTEKFYIRIGDIPSEEKSTIYKGDVVIGYEDGVSVYDCVETDGLYRIVMPLPLKEGQGMTYECLIQEITQCRYKIENPRNVYLVSGIEVGKGHDNEPLIKEVKILKDLTGQFNTKTDNTEETKTLEKLPKFKNGDIVAFDTEKGAQLFIFKEYIHDHWYAKSAKCYMMLDCDGEIDFETDDYYVERLATKEEKEKLFKAIKEHGYKWNEETKTWK